MSMVYIKSPKRGVPARLLDDDGNDLDIEVMARKIGRSKAWQDYTRKSLCA